jgi:hypothetical protein
MNAKKWLVKFVFFVMSFVLLVELKYQLSPGYRHDVDYILNEHVANLKDKSYNTVIIGDSLAHNAFEKLELKKNILDLSSNQAISLAGDYFLLQRYLKNNQVPKEIFLFAIPDFLHNDLNQSWTYSYFETIFTQEHEIKEIQSLKSNLFTAGFDLDKYFESRKKSLNLGGYKPPVRQKHTHVEEKELIKAPKYTNKMLEARIQKSIVSQKKMEIIPKVYLDKIIKLCQDKGIKLTLVIEPLFDECRVIFKNSTWYKTLKEKATKKEFIYVDINDFYTFDKSFFKHDGTHIDGKVNQYYQGLLDKHVLDLF